MMKTLYIKKSEKFMKKNKNTDKKKREIFFLEMKKNWK